MTDIIFVSTALALAKLVLGLLIAWAVLRFLDRLGGQKFTTFWSKLNADDHVGLGLYLGLRFVGVAYLVGAALL